MRTPYAALPPPQGGSLVPTSWSRRYINIMFTPSTFMTAVKSHANSVWVIHVKWEGCEGFAGFLFSNNSVVLFHPPLT